MHKEILSAFGRDKKNPKDYSSLTLAYIGDAVYEVIVRDLVISETDRKVNVLHKKSSQLVKAKTQCDMIKAVLNMLTEEESYIYKRARNANSHTMAKNATVNDYRNATGFEALIGYLYLEGKNERIYEIIKSAYERLDINPYK